MNKIFPLKIQMSFPLKLQALSSLTVIAFIVFSWSALSNSHLPINKTRVFEEDSSQEGQKVMEEKEKGFFHGVDIIKRTQKQESMKRLSTQLMMTTAIPASSSTPTS